MMDNIVSHDLTNQIKTSKDPFLCVKILLSTSLWSFVQEYYAYLCVITQVMDFINYSVSVLDNNADRLSDTERRRYFIQLSTFTLFLLDRLNLWDEYINFFEKLLEKKDCFLKYNLPLKISVDPVYIISENDCVINVHFLYFIDKRYKITKSKLVKQSQWKSVEHLKRHQKSRLSQNEIDRRYKIIIDRLFAILKDEYHYR